MRYADLAADDLMDQLEKEARSCGGFDLIAGGTPCTNLSGENRVPATAATGASGLDGHESRLFYNFAEICRRMVRLYRELKGLPSVDYYR